MLVTRNVAMKYALMEAGDGDGGAESLQGLQHGLQRRGRDVVGEASQLAVTWDLDAPGST